MDEREYARKRAEARQQSSWYKLTVGDNTFRILPTPPTKSHKLNFIEYAVHNDVGAKKERVRCGINPVSEEGECWLCDVKIPGLRKKKMNSRADALAPKSILLVQVAKVDTDDGKMTGPFLFTPSKQIGDQLLSSIFGSKKRSYIDPLKGFNISITRTGTGKNDTRYGMLEPDQEPTKVPQSLLDKVKSFDQLKEIPTYSQAKQQAAYTGQAVPEDDEEAEEPRSRTRHDADEEEATEDDTETAEDEATEEDEPVEEVEDEDLDAEEEEPAPPVKKKKPVPVDDDDEPAPVKKKKPAPVEDEDEPEDEEQAVEEDDEPVEDDEPPAPKKKKKPAPVEDEDEPTEDDGDDPGDEIDLDEVTEEEDEEPPPPKKKVAAPPPKKAAAPPPKKGSTLPPPKKKVR